MSGPLAIGHVTPEDRPAVVALFASGQVRPDRHLAYLSLGVDAIAAELEGLEPDGWDAVLVARRGGVIVGALAVEHDEEPPRVWWHGPAVVDREEFGEVGGALLEAGRSALPGHVAEEELAADDRHRDLAAFAVDHGFTVEPASAVLTRSVSPAIVRPAVDGRRVRPLTDDDRATVAALHDEAFPASHVPGHRIDAGEDRWVLVAEQDGAVVGYVAAERHEDGTGYLDLVGVAPAVRGRGIGADLVAAAVATLAAEGCPSAGLTVRETNGTARRLYERLGFTEERLVRPFRRGFTLR